MKQPVSTILVAEMCPGAFIAPTNARNSVRVCFCDLLASTPTLVGYLRPVTRMNAAHPWRRTDIVLGPTTPYGVFT